MNNFYNLFTRISISEVSFDAKPASGSHPEEAAPQPGTKNPWIKGQSYAAELSENFTNNVAQLSSKNYSCFGKRHFKIIKLCAHFEKFLSTGGQI